MSTSHFDKLSIGFPLDMTFLSCVSSSEVENKQLLELTFDNFDI